MPDANNGWGGSRSHDNQQTKRSIWRRGERFVLELAPGQSIGATVTETRRQVMIVMTDLGQVIHLRRRLDLEELMERADALTDGGQHDPTH